MPPSCCSGVENGSNAEVLDEMRAGKPTVYVNSCSNFDNTQLALQMESLTKALGQVMHISASRF